MDARLKLQEAIIREGKVLPEGILKIDTILNHRVLIPLVDEIAKGFADFFSAYHPTLVLTAEISGISPAVLTAAHLGVPLVYARKKKPITMNEAREIFSSGADSPTKGGRVTFFVSCEVLGPGEKVLLVDDFLATGRTTGALIEICEEAKAEVLGAAAVIEKTFQGGRRFLNKLYPNLAVVSAVKISRMKSGGEIIFED